MSEPCDRSISNQNVFAIAAVLLVTCLALPFGVKTALAGADTAAAPAAITEIHLVTPDGNAAVGAELFVIVRNKASEDESIADAVSDATGVARVRSAVLAGADSTLRCVVETDGCGLTVGPIELNDAHPVVHLLPCSSIKVAFVGPDSKPAAGIVVTPATVGPNAFPPDFFSHWAKLPTALARQLARTTDANGMVTFSNFAREQRVELKIADERYADLSDSLMMGQGDTTPQRTVHLLRAAQVRGVVRFGETGKPAGGVTVSAQSIDGESGWGSAVTDASGQYLLRRIRPGH